MSPVQQQNAAQRVWNSVDAAHPHAANVACSNLILTKLPVVPRLFFLSLFLFPKASSIALASFLFGDERLTPPTDPLRPAADVTPARAPCGTNILRRAGRHQHGCTHGWVGAIACPLAADCSAVQCRLSSRLTARFRLSFWLTNQNHMNEISLVNQTARAHHISHAISS